MRISSGRALALAMSLVVLSGSLALGQTPTASTIPVAGLSATTLASTLLTAGDRPAGMTSQGITNGSTFVIDTADYLVNGGLAIFSPPLAQTDIAVDRIRVTIDTNVPGWNEIDAVELVGTPPG